MGEKKNIGVPQAVSLGGDRVELEALTYPCGHPLCPCGHPPKPGEHGKGKPFKFLGILDVENISCAQDLVLHASLGSVVGGLGHFLLDSRIKRSCGVGVGGFILVTLRCCSIVGIIMQS